MNNSSLSENGNQLSFELKQDYPLSKLTTFGIGGPADWVAFCESIDDIKSAINFASEKKIEYFVLGGGSNVLCSDKGFRGLVIINRIMTFEVTDNTLTCGAGVSLHEAVIKTTEEGLAGFESLSGIAGTVGGAIVGNAGAYGQSISDNLIDVELYHPDKGLYKATKNELDFKYRHSNLKRSRNIVLTGRFQFEQGNAMELTSRVDEILKIRWTKVPKEDISAGCFFKNIEKTDEKYGKLSAGKLLDEIGAKSMSIGQAAVYQKHANIIVNKGGAKANEIRELALKMKKKVLESYGIELNEEVILLGDFS